MTEPRTAPRLPPAAGPPPRPAVTAGAAAPVGPVPVPRPGIVGGAVLAAFAGCAAGLVGLVATAADRPQLRGRLEAAARAGNPAAPADLIRTSVRTTVLIAVGGAALLGLVALLWAALVLRRKRWARRLLALTALLAVVLAALAQAVVAGGVDVDRAAFLAQAALVLLGSALAFAPAAGSWLRDG